MTALKIVFYPSTGAFSGSGQLELGPFHVGVINKLTQVRLNGSANFEAAALIPTGIIANLAIYGIQWVPHGNSPGDVVLSAYDDTWPIRHQWGVTDWGTSWTPTANDANVMNTWGIWGHWAGQLAIGADTDLWFLLKSPTGQAIDNFNLFASLEAWWV